MTERITRPAPLIAWNRAPIARIYCATEWKWPPGAPEQDKSLQTILYHTIPYQTIPNQNIPYRGTSQDKSLQAEWETKYQTILRLKTPPTLPLLQMSLASEEFQ